MTRQKNKLFYSSPNIGKWTSVLFSQHLTSMVWSKLPEITQKSVPQFTTTINVDMISGVNILALPLLTRKRKAGCNFYLNQTKLGWIACGRLGNKMVSDYIRHDFLTVVDNQFLEHLLRNQDIQQARNLKTSPKKLWVEDMNNTITLQEDRLFVVELPFTFNASIIGIFMSAPSQRGLRGLRF